LWSVIKGYRLTYGIYVQAAVAVGVIALFGMMIYRWVAVKPNSVDFLIATEGEMKKVNWPTRREVIGSTLIVIVFLAFIAIILFGSDSLFYLLFKTVHVLDI
jgi:preprotein translocase subunit SecE